MNRYYPLILALFAVFSMPVEGKESQAASSAVFDNGLRVLVQKRSVTPLVALDLWVRAGAREEASSEIGAAHFLEHVLFKGTDRYRNGETDVKMEQLGGTLNAATGPDFAHYYTTVPANNLVGAIALLADIVRFASFPEEEVEKERSVILNELEIRSQDSSAQITDLLYSSAFSKQAYGRSYGGTTENITACKLSALRSFYKRTYIPSNCVLAIAGDIDPKTAIDSARKCLGDWKNIIPEVKAKVKSVFNEPDLAQKAAISVPSIDSAIRFAIGYPCPPAGDNRNSSCAKLVEALLGSSDKYGRLKCKELSGIKAEIRMAPRLDSSLFSVIATFEPTPNVVQSTPSDSLDRFRQTKAVLLNIIESLKISPPSSDELDSAKVRVLTQLQHDTETDAGLARYMGYAHMSGGSRINEFKKQILEFTSDDVRHFAAQYLDVNRSIEIKLLPGRQQRSDVSVK